MGALPSAAADSVEQSEHRRMLRDSVADFAARGTDVARARRLPETRMERDPRVWKELAELGWLGVLVPEAHGGLGLGLGEMAVVAEGLARALVPEPLTACAVLAARVLGEAQNRALSASLLSGLAAGDVAPVVAWQEQAGVLDASACETVAVPFEGGYRVNGEKRFIAGAPGADGFIVSARAADGMRLLWMPREAPGVRLEREPLADGREFGTLRLADAVVAGDQVIASGGAASESLARAVDHAAVIVGAELCGVARRTLEMSLDYMKTRVQFGKPIGSFQALQHRAVDLYLQQELAAAVLAEALEALDREPDAATRAALASRAKARCADAALRTTREAIQLHGAIGYTEDCDVGLYVKRALVLSAWLGNAAAHRQRYAALTLSGADATP